MLTGWKTFLTAIAFSIFGALETLDFTQFLNADNAGYVTLALSVIMMILRALTRTPILKSE